jgi:hypothetical protein
MTSIERADPAILGHVLAEHRDLFRLITLARKAFAADAPTSDLEPTLNSLRELRHHLHDHFLQEEEGGFLEEAVTRVPRLSQAMREIVGQHPGLLSELDNLIAALARSGQTGEAWLGARQAFDAFAAHLQAHERSENAVVQAGYNEDLGLVD